MHTPFSICVYQHFRAVFLPFFLIQFHYSFTGPVDGCPLHGYKSDSHISGLLGYEDEDTIPN